MSQWFDLNSPGLGIAASLSIPGGVLWWLQIISCLWTLRAASLLCMLLSRTIWGNYSWGNGASRWLMTYGQSLKAVVAIHYFYSNPTKWHHLPSYYSKQTWALAQKVPCPAPPHQIQPIWILKYLSNPSNTPFPLATSHPLSFRCVYCYLWGRSKWGQGREEAPLHPRKEDVSSKEALGFIEHEILPVSWHLAQPVPQIWNSLDPAFMRGICLKGCPWKPPQVGSRKSKVPSKGEMGKKPGHPVKNVTEGF